MVCRAGVFFSRGAVLNEIVAGGGEGVEGDRAAAERLLGAFGRSIGGVWSDGLCGAGGGSGASDGESGAQFVRFVVAGRIFVLRDGRDSRDFGRVEPGEAGRDAGALVSDGFERLRRGFGEAAVGFDQFDLRNSGGDAAAGAGVHDGRNERVVVSTVGRLF